MKSIKTINLKANEIQAVEMPDLHCHVRNGGTSTVFASRYADVTPYGDGVLEIKSGDSKTVRDIFDYHKRQGFVYLFSESDTSVELESANDVNFFRKINSGGENSGTVDTYNRSEIDTKLSEKADNSELKTVALTGSYKDLSDTTDVATKNYVSNLLSNKVDKVYGKDLSTNDYTDEEVEKIQNNIYQIDTIKSTMGITCKNLANIDTSGDAEDFIYTVNPDKTVTCNGRATSSYALHIMSKPIRLSKNKKYILSGAVAGYVNLLIYYQKGTYEYEGEIYPRIYPQYNNESVQIKDTGEGCIFIPREDHDCFIMLNNVGKVDMTDIVVSPMLRTYDYLDDTEFEPHTDLLSMINDLTARVQALENKT